MLKNLTYIFVVFFIISLIFIGILGIYLYISFTSPLDKDYREIVFTIEKGDTLDDIISSLKEQKILKNGLIFKIMAIKYQPQGVMAGQYIINTNQTLYGLLNILSSKPNFNDDLVITIIEGWSREDIALYFQRENIADAQDFLDYTATILNVKEKFSLIFNNFSEGISLEGFLFPDTYRIKKDCSVKGIVDKMLANFQEKVIISEIIKNNKTNLSFYEIIILASILEKEVANEQDRRMVADILLKRLDEGIKLQVDASVNFITNKNSSRSSYEDISIDNPYNTYKYAGLPPGPICNPSLSSIKAAADPLENDYYFYLTSKSGQIYFAETFQGHKENRKYLDL